MLPVALFFDPKVDFGVFDPKIWIFNVEVLVLKSHILLSCIPC